MVQVKADGVMSAIFGPIKERAEILDDNGALLGYFEPVGSEEDVLYRKAALLFDPKEVQRSTLADGVWKTTDEVLGRLNPQGNP
jgi:hypothetical protein